MSGLRTRLKKTIKYIAYWTVPPAYQDITGRQWYALKNRFNRDLEMEALFQRNIKFKDIHKGQRCFILATGPSINKQDLRPLKNEICIAVSMFFLHKDVKEINPIYHVDSPNHAPFKFGLIQKCFDGFKNYYTEKINYFFGHTNYDYSVRNFMKQNSQPNEDSYYYLNYCQSPPLDEDNYNNPSLWDICQPLFGTRTVVYSAIQVARYMGFKYIYLLGCDHDYLTDISRGSSEHFYLDEKGVDDSALWISAEKIFLAYHIRWKQYRLMREFIESHGCFIYNATEGGMLDVFPRVTLAEAITGVHENR